MGEARRRRRAGSAVPRKFTLVAHGQHDRTLDDGTMQRFFTFHVADADGKVVVTDSAAGPQPVVIASLPITVGKAALLLPTSLRG